MQYLPSTCHVITAKAIRCDPPWAMAPVHSHGAQTLLCLNMYRAHCIEEETEAKRG